MVTNQAEPGKLRRAHHSVLLNFFRREEGTGFPRDLVKESLQRFGFAEIGRKNFGGEVAPIVEAFAVGGQVALGIVGKTEVGQKKAACLELRNCIQRGVPELDLNIWRRSGRKHKGMSFDAEAGGVADKCDGASGIKISDMVRGVAGCVENAKLARTTRNGFSAMKHMQVFGGYRKKGTEEAIHFLTVQTPGARKELCWVGHVRCAAGMDENPERRIFADEFAGGTRVIQMNVSEKNGVEMRDGETLGRKVFAKSVDCRGRTGIDQCGEIGVAKKSRSDGARTSQPEEIKRK